MDNILFIFTIAPPHVLGSLFNPLQCSLPVTRCFDPALGLLGADEGWSMENFARPGKSERLDAGSFRLFAWQKTVQLKSWRAHGYLFYIGALMLLDVGKRGVMSVHDYTVLFPQAEMPRLFAEIKTVATLRCSVLPPFPLVAQGATFLHVWETIRGWVSP